jgi:hypothetical protein
MGTQEMFGDFGTRAWRIASWLALQTVPPSLLSAYAASQLAAATGMPILEVSAFLAAALLACVLISGSQE